MFGNNKINAPSFPCDDAMDWQKLGAITKHSSLKPHWNIQIPQLCSNNICRMYLTIISEDRWQVTNQ